MLQAFLLFTPDFTTEWPPRINCGLDSSVYDLHMPYGCYVCNLDQRINQLNPLLLPLLQKCCLVSLSLPMSCRKSTWVALSERCSREASHRSTHELYLPRHGRGSRYDRVRRRYLVSNILLISADKLLTRAALRGAPRYRVG